jgi:ABC-type glycerol-3-phosphate transport system substrate-binding protein
MKKGLRILLPVILLAALVTFAACGGGNNETTPTPPPEEAGTNNVADAGAQAPSPVTPEPEPDPGPPPRDLGGIEILIANWWSEYDTDTADPDTFAGRERLADRRMLEERHNFRIREVRFGSWDDVRDNHPLLFATRNTDHHVWVLQPDWFASLALRGLLAPIPMTYFTEGTGAEMNWHQETMDWARMYSSDPSYITGFTQGFGETAGGVYFNMRLFEEAGLPRDYPFTLQAEGRWDWDNFTRVARQLTRDTDGDGVNDTFALATFHQDFLPRAIVSNGGAIVSICPDTGRFINTSQTPELYEALAWVVQLREEGLAMHENDIGGEWNFFIEMFNNGGAAMRAGGSYIAGAQINPNLIDDWGFVAFPKGPRAQNHYSFMTQNLMAIPAAFSPEEVDKIMYAFMLWNRPLGIDEEGEDDDWKFEQMPNFRDMRSIEETMVWYTRNAAFQRTAFHALVPGGFPVGEGFAWRVWTDEFDAQTILEEVQLVWNEVLERANEDLGLN